MESERLGDWHRSAVGGLWHEIGELQFQLMVDEGLNPRHRLLDIGCGSMRGGVHFIRHLDAGHYVGVDANAELLEAGRGEIAQAGLEEKLPMLVHRRDFEFRDLGVFDFAIAQSLFTHLPFNSIVRCLARTAEVLRPGGRLLATFFANTGSRLRTEPFVIHARDGVVLTVNLDDDPFYYVPELFEWVCEGSSFSCEYRGEWGHPRNQHLLAFTKRS